MNYLGMIDFILTLIGIYSFMKTKHKATKCILGSLTIFILIDIYKLDITIKIINLMGEI